MNKIGKQVGRLLLILLALSMSFFAYAEGGKRVVASTSWTGAFALSAGADDVSVIAPFELKHPPEYDIKPSDIEQVKKADLIIFAGYEKFIPKIKETSGAVDNELLQIQTVNDYATMVSQTKKIAEKLGTEAEQKKFVDWLDSFYENWQNSEDTEELRNSAAVVHTFQAGFIKSLGIKILGTFGPQSPSPKVINDLIAEQPVLVIDNYHNPVGKAIAESSSAKYTQLINFPGKNDTKTLKDVLNYNMQQLFKASTLNDDEANYLWYLIIGGVIVIVIIMLIVVLTRKKTTH